MMSLSVINNYRESFRVAQAEARERDKRILTALEARKASQERPNQQLLVKAPSEGEAHVYATAHGLMPGEIRRLNDTEQLVRVYCDDIRLLQRWFAMHLGCEYPLPNGALLMWSPLNGSGVTMVRDAA